MNPSFRGIHGKFPIFILLARFLIATGSVASEGEGDFSSRISSVRGPGSHPIANIAQASGAAHDADVPPSESEIHSIVLASLKPLVHKTKRDLTFYSYGWRTPRYPDGTPPAGVWDDSVAIPSESAPMDFSGPLPKGEESELARKYFVAKARGFFGTTNQVNLYGRGVYAAPEPLSSLDYSGRPGLLLEIRVSPGVTYLDLRANWRPIVKASADGATRVDQYLRPFCKGSPGCLAGLDDSLRQNGDGAFFLPDLLRFESTNHLLERVFGELGIQAIAGVWDNVFEECGQRGEGKGSDFIFIDPKLADRISLRLIVPIRSADLASENLQSARRLIEFFDSFDFSDAQETALGIQDPACKSCELAREAFWSYYRAWAPVVHELTPDVDLREFQRRRSQTLKKSRHAALTSGVFGCSPDPAYVDEVRPGV